MMEKPSLVALLNTLLKSATENKDAQPEKKPGSPCPHFFPNTREQGLEMVRQDYGHGLVLSLVVKILIN